MIQINRVRSAKVQLFILSKVIPSWHTTTGTNIHINNCKRHWNLSPYRL